MPLKHWLFVGGLIAGAVMCTALGLCTILLLASTPIQSPSAAEDSVTAPIVSTQAPIQSTSVAADLPKLSDSAKLAGYSLAVLTVSDSARASTFYKPEPGKKLIAVEIVLGNISGKKISSNPLYATLIDGSGFAYTPELAALAADQIKVVDLNPGERVRGWIGFKIPNQALTKSLKYEINGYSDIVLQVSLTK